MDRILDPKKIEDKSFEIIDGLLGSLKMPYEEREVLKRVIHTTTDLGYVETLSFHPLAVSAGLNAIKSGRDIVCDVGMVKTGVNEKVLADFGGRAMCFINDDDVIRTASRLGITRAIAAMRKASELMEGAIVSIGNAPTALFELCDMVKDGKVRPALIIGVPVGFVGAAESKKELSKAAVPFITNHGTKGGSSVAAAITNALLKIAQERA